MKIVDGHVSMGAWHRIFENGLLVFEKSRISLMLEAARV